MPIIIDYKWISIDAQLEIKKLVFILYYFILNRWMQKSCVPLFHYIEILAKIDISKNKNPTELCILAVQYIKKYEEHRNSTAATNVQSTRLVTILTNMHIFHIILASTHPVRNSYFICRNQLLYLIDRNVSTYNA